VSDPKIGHRRIDRIRDGAYTDGLESLSLDEVRTRRDESLAEREYVSLLRRLLQGRAEILQAELAARGTEEDSGPLVDRLATILAGDETAGTSRGEAFRVGVPEDELLMARRRVERLVADVGISDPSVLDDASLKAAVETLAAEERELSDTRSFVIGVVDRLQAELMRRYKDDPSLALR
jgi:hypothetical protein